MWAFRLAGDGVHAKRVARRRRRQLAHLIVVGMKRERNEGLKSACLVLKCARTKHVMSVGVGRPIALLGAGSLVGLLLGVFASPLLGQIVYQASTRDPVVVVGAVLTMALLGIAASALPALRALAVDPSKLLREE
jgi:ABC-type microcin C transport system permease subunit YejB